MTDEPSLNWLKRMAGEIGGGPLPGYARRILEMLAEPRLPVFAVRACFPPTERYTMSEWDAVEEALLRYHARLYTQLAKPATKTVWSVVSPHATSGGFDCRLGALTWASINVPDSEPFSLTCAEEPA